MHKKMCSHIALHVAHAAVASHRIAFFLTFSARLTEIPLTTPGWHSAFAATTASPARGAAELFVLALRVIGARRIRRGFGLDDGADAAVAIY